MDDSDLDRALLTGLFEQAALQGWDNASIADAARAASLPLARVRGRFPGKGAALLRFGLIADQSALGLGAADETPRERLFDMVMRRFDALQHHRDGVLALLRALPRHPGTTLLLHGATLRSMRWLLDAAGVPTGGVAGALRVNGMLLVWLRGLRAWQADESEDLAGVMAAIDKALDQAVRAEAWLPFGGGSAAEAAETFEEAGLDEDPATDPPPTVPPEPPASPPPIM